ncbi:hypothetical protein SAMN05421676_108102 [Salinibacillus kushneri]|uniref:Uncharacterized protein n=1 Tax=Salinibacillus kushneri TaxID=237682 RepID=A0A1I0HAJ9_9BACI|nr:hypothetical protein [Salinibacillus kushneri]SET79863.1 hypothetical protein SAMN05421676_108102 [Salinibacillus kushneri]
MDQKRGREIQNEKLVTKQITESYQSGFLEPEMDKRANETRESQKRTDRF